MNANWPRLSRRAFLRLALLAGIGGGAGVVYRETEAVGFANWFRWMLRGRTEKLAAPVRVGLAICESYDQPLGAALRQALVAAGVTDLQGARVVV